MKDLLVPGTTWNLFHQLVPTRKPNLLEPQNRPEGHMTRTCPIRPTDSH